MTTDYIPPILTARELAKRVMAGETITIPAIQFSQFLFEADIDRVEFCMKAEQRGYGIIFTKWEL